SSSATRPQLHVCPSLHDGEESLVWPTMTILAALGPENRPADRILYLFWRRGKRRAFLQTHGDVRAEVFLDRNRLFRAQLQADPIDVGLKYRRLVANSTAQRQTVDLETTAVGQNRPVPIHEAMQAAQLGDQLLSGSKREMVGI